MVLETIVLPLNYTPKRIMEGGRFELPNPKERIYSPPRLATSLPLQKSIAKFQQQEYNTIKSPPTSREKVKKRLFIHFIWITTYFLANSIKNQPTSYIGWFSAFIRSQYKIQLIYINQIYLLLK